MPIRSRCHRRGGNPTARGGGGLREPESPTEGGAAKHRCGVLHVRYGSIICSQLGLIVYSEGPVAILDEPVRGSHQVYLCHASRTVFEGGADKAPVPIRHTRWLCAWGVMGKS